MLRAMGVFSAAVPALLLGACMADTAPAPPLAVPAEASPTAQLQLTGWVVDEAAVLDEEIESEFAGQLKTIRDDTLAQLVVVTVPSLGGQDIANYSRDLANRWGVGHRDRDDGLLIVVAPTERRVRIEVGLGLEERVDDAFAATVIDDMTPHLRTGDYDAGIQAGIDRLGERLRETALREAA